MKKGFALAIMMLLFFVSCSLVYAMSNVQKIAFVSAVQRNPQFGRVYDALESQTLYYLNIDKEDIAITKLSFILNKNATNAGLTVYSLKTTATFIKSLPEKYYELNEIKYSGFVPFDTSFFAYDFRVPKGWLMNNSFSRSAITLYAYDRNLEIWEAIETDITGEDDSFVFFESKGDAAHYLLIGKSEEELPVETEADEEKEQNIETNAYGQKENTASSGTNSQGQVSAEENVEMDSKVIPADLETKKPETAVVKVQADTDTEYLAGNPEKEKSRFVAVALLIFIVTLLSIVYVVSLKDRKNSSVDKELNNYIKECLRRGKTKKEVRDRLLEVGWHPERIDQALSKHGASKSGHIERIKRFVRRKRSNHN